MGDHPARSWLVSRSQKHILAQRWHTLAPLISLFLVLLLVPGTHQTSALGERTFHSLSEDDISMLVSTPDPTKSVDLSDSNSHLSKILIPRSPDTDNNTFVKNYLATTMRNLGWHVEEDTFTDKTPYGNKRFTNVIATKDPSARRRVIVAAHFDSKFFPTFPQNQFVGATDSAAPCAMMLDLAEALNPLLDHRKDKLKAGHEDEEETAETTLQLLFLDGEEAFKEWTNDDSIYGARHLAEKWSTTYINPITKRRLLRTTETEISTIEHFILLDLLGAPHPLIQSYFADTHWLFDALEAVEHRLNNANVLVLPDPQNPSLKPKFDSFFLPRKSMHWAMGHIEDDHIPFLRKGVSVLHLISSPFPRVWHTLKDDASALDAATMRRWIIVL